MRKAIFVFALAVVAVAAVPWAAQAGHQLQTVGLTATTSTGAFVGAFHITSFAVVRDQLVAIGTVTGMIETSDGMVTQMAAETVTVAVNIQQASCTSLWLALGPFTVAAPVGTIPAVVVVVSAEQPSPRLSEGVNALHRDSLCAIAAVQGDSEAVAAGLNHLLDLP